MGSHLSPSLNFSLLFASMRRRKWKEKWEWGRKWREKHPHFVQRPLPPSLSGIISGLIQFINASFLPPSSSPSQSIHVSKCPRLALILSFLILPPICRCHACLVCPFVKWRNEREEERERREKPDRRNGKERSGMMMLRRQNRKEKIRVDDGSVKRGLR